VALVPGLQGARLSPISLVTLGVMTDQSIPAPIQAFIDTTNAGDNEGFVAVFTDNAYVRDWGREFNGHEGVASWNRTDNIGVNMKFELISCEATGPGPESYALTIKATSNRFNGTGTMQITLRNNLISRLEIG
jgi:hypothetical protein